jgi:hypothetical protein
MPQRQQPLPDPERFLLNVQKEPGEDGCWLWVPVSRGACIDRDGYGRFHYRGRPGVKANWHRAYRVAYRLFVGEIPEDRPVLDHLCRNRRCVNPKHLEPVTSRENTIRGMSPPGINYRKRTCKYGHPLGAVKNKHGAYPWRYCVVCERLRYGKASEDSTSKECADVLQAERPPGPEERVPAPL